MQNQFRLTLTLNLLFLQSLTTEIDEDVQLGDACWGNWLGMNISECYISFLKPQNQLGFTCRLCYQISKGQTGKQASCFGFFFPLLFLSY